MKQPFRRILRHATNILGVCGFVAICYAADAPQPASDTSDIQILKQQLADQQKQIEELRLLLLNQQKQIQSASKNTATTEVPVLPPAPPLVPKGIGEVAGLTPILPPIPVAAAPVPTAVTPPLPPPLPPPAPQAAADQVPNSPLQLKVGASTITPVGFMDMTNTWRSTNSGATLATNFGNFPYGNVPAGHLSEDTMSAQNSRLGVRFDSTFKGSHVLGYYEGDFVGFVPTNAEVTSNSFSYRLRLFWINVRKGFWEFQAGQSWSMLTPNRRGISALPGDLFYGQEFDVNYLNGLTWGRIPGYRFIGHPSKSVTFGISLENAQQYIGGSGGSSTVTLPAAFAGNNFNNSVNNGGTTTSVPDLHPDIIGKVVFEPSSHFHFEIAGVERTFKTYNPTTNTTFTKAGGGGSVNLNWEVAKNFRLITNNYWSDGGGRYLFGEAPDLIVRPDGSPSLVHSGSTVSGIEATVKNLTFFSYYGGILIGKDTALDTGNKLIGWGYNGASSAQNRTIQEGTFGWIHTLWRDNNYGAVQWMFQYAYFSRSPYNFVPTGTPNNANQHAVWFNLRYVLPGTAPTIQY